nr:importin subunit alpha-9 [Tanacetum cinerariifolium]
MEKREITRLLFDEESMGKAASIAARVIPLLGQCLKLGSKNEQLLEAAWCLTYIAAGKSEETKALLPTLPLLIAHLGVRGGDSNDGMTMVVHRTSFKIFNFNGKECIDEVAGCR